MNCKKCGAIIRENSKFCENCGAPVELAGPVYEEYNQAEPETIPEPETVTEEQYESASQAEPQFEGASQSAPRYEYVEPETAKTGGNQGFAIASLVCGILSLVCCCCCNLLSIVLSLVAIGLGIVTIVKGYDGKGMAIAGIACGGVGIVGKIVFLIIGASASTILDMNDFMGIDGFDDLMDIIDSL